MTFEQAFKALIGHEGGYVNHPSDPGGETNFGITKRSYPAEDIRGMTLARAKVIYHRDFWLAAGCNYVPESARFDLFDMAVNSGVKPAIMAMQRAVGADADGAIGPKTLMLLDNIDPLRFRMRFNGYRLQLMSTLSHWPTFGRGWANRIAKNLIEA